MTQENVQVRLATHADIEQITGLLSELGLLQQVDETNLREKWDRILDSNPFYKYFDEPIVYGWVLTHDEKVVGFFGTIPRVYYLYRQLVGVSIGSQWAVKKEYRKPWVKLLCEKMFYDNPLQHKIATTAIVASGRIYERYGGIHYRGDEFKTTYMIPLNITKLLKHKYKSLRPLIQVVGALLPWGLQYKLLKNNPYIQQIEPDNIPEHYNEFWKRYLAKFDGLIAARQADILQWYYGSGVYKGKHRLFIYQDSDNKIQGFAAILESAVVENPDIKRFKLIDIFTDTDEIQKQMLQAIVRYCYKAGADIVEIQFDAVKRNDIPFFTIARSLPHNPVYFQSIDKDLQANIGTVVPWKLSPFDGDAALG